MKVLSVVWSTLGDTATSRRIWNIAKSLLLLGHEIHIVQYVRRPAWDMQGGNKFSFGDIPQSTIFVSGYAVHIRHLRELCRDKYDLVYGNAHGGAFSSLLGKLKRVPLIFDMHGSMVEEFMLVSGSDGICKTSFNLLLNNFLETIDARFSDKISCVSRKAIEFLYERKRVPLEKMAYVPNGVDLEFFKPLDDEKIGEMRKLLGIEDKLVFGYVGGFQKWQGVENLIEAARRIDDKNVAFLIVGGNRKRMEKEKNILFGPRVPHSQVPLFYSVSDILVLPRPSHLSTEIASPTKFAEYVAMKKPVLVTNVGDAAGLVTRYNCGIVIDNNSAQSLAEGIEEFREKSQRELNIMGRNSRKMAENEFDWNKIRDNLHELVESIR